MKSANFFNRNSKNNESKGIETLNNYEMNVIRGGEDKPKTKDIDIY